MEKKEKVVQVVYKAIDKLNQLLADNEKLEKSLDTAIIGQKGQLDSVGIINFVVSLEEIIKDEFGVMFVLSEKLMLGDMTFSSVGAIVDYISDNL